MRYRHVNLGYHTFFTSLKVSVFIGLSTEIEDVKYMKEQHLFTDHTQSIEVRLNDLMSKLTLEEKIGLLSARGDAIPRLGIKAFNIGGEAAHGIVDRSGGHTTVFPQPIGLSATWNPELMKEVGSAIGDEARIFYDNNNQLNGVIMFAPTVDLERDPRWGRTEEAYGEDPHLVGTLSKELIKGMQGEDEYYYKMVTTPKHFFGNNNEVGRCHINNSIDPRNRREYYLKAFEPAYMEARAASMMTSYSGINGIPGMEINELKEVVKGEWGMDGFILCDGGAFGRLIEEYGHHKTYAEGLAQGLKQGLDIFLDDKSIVELAAKEALGRGLMTEDDLTPAIANMMRVRLRLGHFDLDKTANPYEFTPKEKYCSKEHADLALKATEEQIVLLKNDGILPLDKAKLNKIAVIGALGNENHRDWYAGYAPYLTTVFGGLDKHLENCEIVFENGHDKITLKEKATGKYVTVNDLGELQATAQIVGDDETFELEDWGWNYHVMRHVKTNMYVGQGDDNHLYSVNQGKPEVTDQNPDYSTHREEVYDWFIKEKIGFYPKDDAITLRGWQDKNIAVDENHHLKAAVKATEFEIERVKAGIASAVKVAKESDVAVVVVGNHPMINGREIEDRPDITLPAHQEALIKAVYEANPNTIVVIVGSYPFAVNWPDAHIPAIMYSSHSTQELGNAVANVLTGEVDPSGRLSMTWYKDTSKLTDIFDYDVIKSNRTYLYFEHGVLYPFGHGLSYSSFEYRDMKLNQVGKEIQVQVTIKNTGARIGTEVVQLYAKALNPSVKRPLKQLVAFEKITLEAKASMTVNLCLTEEALEFWDVSREKYCLETGRYEFMVGASSLDIKLTEAVDLVGEVVPPRDLHKLTKAENYDAYENISLDKGKGNWNAVVVQGDGWIQFKNVDFKDGTNRINFQIRALAGAAKIKVAIDDQENIVCAHDDIPANLWKNLHMTFEETTGIHDLYVLLGGAVAINGLWLE